MARYFATAAAVTPPTYTGGLTVGTITTITNDSSYNAWPVVVKLATGELFLAYVKASTHNEDNTGNVVAKISTDDGATWGSEFTIADDATNGAINPVLLVTSTGRLILSYNLFSYPTTPTDAVRVRYSDDPEAGSGATWSSPYTVNSAFTGECSNGTGNMVQLADDTILLPIYGLQSGGTYASSRVFFSTDDGATFGSETVMADGPGDSRQYYEPTIVLLEDGTLLGIYRTSAGTGTHYQNTSTDDGATWSATSAEFAGFGAPRGIQGTSGTIIVATRSNSSATSAYTSIDDAANWSSEVVLDSSMFENEYAAPVELAEGSYLVVYGYQPTSSTSNSDIKQVLVTEVTA